MRPSGVFWTLAAFAWSTNLAAADPPRQFGAVICTAEDSGPWRMRAQGTLKRTKSASELIYELDAAGDSFTWRFVTTAQGATTAISPGYLMDRFPVAAAQPASVAGRSQNLQATGEIRESGPSGALRLVIGSKCPTRTK